MARDALAAKAASKASSAREASAARVALAADTTMDAGGGAARAVFLQSCMPKVVFSTPFSKGCSFNASCKGLHSCKGGMGPKGW